MMLYVPDHMHLHVTCVYTRVLACMDVCEYICARTHALASDVCVYTSACLLHGCV